MIDIQSILSRYSPDSEEENGIEALVSHLKGQIRSIITRDGIEAEPVLVGSVAKHTNLKNADIDIFIVFSRKYTTHQMERLGLRIGHEVLPDGKERYAEHPYVSGTAGGRKIDLVPCFRIEKGTSIVSSVDRTPLHTEYVLSNLDREGQNQVRLLKLFMKAIGVYGSEVRTHGFSGYVCELLIINRKSFQEVLRFFAGNRGRIVIPENTALADRTEAPLVILDPTDASRNAAASVSLENLSRMKLESRLYLHDPSDRFFIPAVDPVPVPARDNGTSLRIIRIPRPDLVDDIIYSQGERMRKILVERLEAMGFRVIDSDLYVGNTVDVLLETENLLLPSVVRHIGPPVDTDNSVDFVRKWRDRAFRGPYVQEDRVCADIYRDMRGLDESILSVLKGANIGKNLQSFKQLIKIIDPIATGESFAVLGKYYSRKLVS